MPFCILRRLIFSRPRFLCLLAALVPCLILLCAASPSASAAPAALDDPFTLPPHLARTEKSTTWQLWFFQLGSRSEGTHGRLYIDDQEILGAQDGETRDSHLGRFVWRGGVDSRAHLWSDSGWMPEGIDVRTLKRSAYTQAAGFATLTGERPYIRQDQGNALWVGWKSSKSSPVHGDLRVNGRWLTGAAEGERTRCDLGEFVWKGHDGREPHNGWVWLDGKGEPSAGAAPNF